MPWTPTAGPSSTSTNRPTSSDTFHGAWHGYSRSVEVAMERIRIAKPVKPKERPKILPLDPRDPEIVRAKAIQDATACPDLA